ncbi:MAG: FtsW/RodA/SpoVE family cell cycle protein [Thermonemataceae bacterium]|nr:FtsW/RodA/SpoVE family cell cycle protein [Thermonemataceae bacterium]
MLSNPKLKSSIFKGDPIIWYITLALAIISVLVVYSATQSLAYRENSGDTVFYLKKHGFFVVVTLFVMWIAHRIDYRFYVRLSKLAVFLSIPLIIFTMFFGVEQNEAVRSLIIPGINISFRPSDFAKLALITHLATMLSKRQKNIHSFKESVIPMITWIGLICGLIAINNFSTSIVIFATAMLVLFIGRVPSRYFVILVVSGILVIGLALRAGSRWETFLSRMQSYSELVKNPESVAHSQIEQSFIAIGTGGFWGKGPGKSSQQEFLSQAFSDFIFAVLVEEYGFLGGSIVIFLYLALLYRSMTIMSRSNRPFGGLLASGLAFSLVMQALVHICVTLGLVPVTGLPLPLLSMGGTSLLFTGVALGIILSVSRGDIEEPETENFYTNA